MSSFGYDLPHALAELLRGGLELGASHLADGAGSCIQGTTLGTSTGAFLVGEEDTTASACRGGARHVLAVRQKVIWP